MFYIVTTIFVVSISAAVMFVFSWHVCCCYVCGAVMFVAGCYVCCWLLCLLLVCLPHTIVAVVVPFVCLCIFLQEKTNPRTVVVQRTRCVARLLQNLNLFRSKTDGLSKAG